MSTDGSHAVALSGDAGIRNAADVARRLKEALARHGGITIDTAQVTRADVTTVQTLLAARRQALGAGGGVMLRAPLGEALDSVLRAGGFLASGQGDAGFWPVATGNGATGNGAGRAAQEGPAA